MKVLTRLPKSRLKVLLKVFIRLLKARLTVLPKVLIRLLKDSVIQIFKSARFGKTCSRLSDFKFSRVLIVLAVLLGGL